MNISSNFESVINRLQSNLSNIQIDQMTRAAATTLLAVMRTRIHVDGIDSNGTQIGTYTPAYIKYTRAKSGRGTDNKVVLSLTRAMENSEELFPIPNGTGIGFSTKENWQKARWCEQTYGKRIFKPTPEERVIVNKVMENYISKHIGNG